ncbi:uncharacterized protein BJ171DRAFT_610059 [Polychytrium aggregatum]|uniref:uncharacterized protein n=1 Tax=Polychytrium aggregatum TaxID=110093 RepID=UPI0022FF3262|nr:uncharacterized protein BJ171DRAFT_610059 [Polychytrium aggregatum]KAI9206783.1 hypothetical protein BJ171DRAFT_610059 [Polychytrium aggregatum]
MDPSGIDIVITRASEAGKLPPQNPSAGDSEVLFHQGWANFPDGPSHHHPSSSECWNKAHASRKTGVQDVYASFSTFMLGWCYLQGIGVARDEKQACILFQESIVDAFQLGKMVFGPENNKGYYHLESDSHAATVFFDRCKLATSISPSWICKHLVALCHLYGYGVARSEETAVQVLMDLAHEGHDVSQTELAKCLYTGYGVSKYYTRSIYWFQKAADMGYQGGQFGLGISFYYGKGNDRNYKKAANFFERSALQGNSAAQFCLGICYN